MHSGGCRTQGTSYYSSTSSLVHEQPSGRCIDLSKCLVVDLLFFFFVCVMHFCVDANPANVLHNNLTGINILRQQSHYIYIYMYVGVSILSDTEVRKCYDSMR